MAVMNMQIDRLRLGKKMKTIIRGFLKSQAPYSVRICGMFLFGGLSLTCASMAAQAQTVYYLGQATTGNPVSVDIEALDGLGKGSTLADLLRPGAIPAQKGSPATRNITPEQLSKLPRPKPTRLAPAAMPQSGLVKAKPVAKPKPVPSKIAVAKPAQPPKTPLISGLTPAKKPTPALTGVKVKPKAVKVAKPAPVKTAIAVPKAPAVPVAKPAKTGPVAVKVPTPVAKKIVAPIPPAPVVKAKPLAVPKVVAKKAPVVSVPKITAPDPSDDKTTVVAKAVPVAKEIVPKKTEVKNEVVKKAETPTVVAPVAAKAVTKKAETKTAVPVASTQIAALDPTVVLEENNKLVSIRFAVGSEDLPAAAQSALDRLVEKLLGDDEQRVQLKGYAVQDDGGSVNQARRLSLFRALKVRSYLIKKGVRSTRMDVRALGGQKKSEDNPNRVDVVLP